MAVARSSRAGHPIRSRRFSGAPCFGIFLPAIVASALTNAACGDACRPGETICEGYAIFACGSPGEITGNRDFTEIQPGCGSDMCLDIRNADGTRGAVCSATGMPDPRCAQGASGTHCIDADTVLTCEDGYGSGETTCSGRCVTVPANYPVPSYGFCAAEATPNPACDTKWPTACDGDTLVSCKEGWVIARTPCATRCVTGGGGLAGIHAYCAEDATCSGPDVASCAGNTIEGCIAGYVVSSDCGADECVTYGPAPNTGASCEPRCQHVVDDACVDP